MWVRKRLDISWWDFHAARVGICLSWSRHAATEQLEATWDPGGAGLACLSVRSGLDLLLGQSGWPAGSEIAMSAMTIPDMARIIRHHDLVPVPVDLGLDTAAPTLDSLRRAITPKTRALLIAHLLGTRIPLEPVLALASDHGLAVIEDCAQACVGPGWTGTPGTLASLFSFGPIKTATAIGGALLTVRDEVLLERIRREQATWPVQGRFGYGLKINRNSLLKLLSGRLSFKAFLRACRFLGLDYDNLLNNAVRGFPSDDLLRLIRRRPSAPLLALLHRRLQQFPADRLERRRQLGEQLREACRDSVVMLGHEGRKHTFWVFPVLAEDPPRLIAAMRKAGFDATQGASMEIVAAPEGREDTAAGIREAFQRIVYLPVYPEMSEAVVSQIAEIVKTANRPPEATSSSPQASSSPAA